MRSRIALGTLGLAVLVATSVVAGGTLKSGPQLGKTPTPFHPLNVTGSSAGEKQCLV